MIRIRLTLLLFLFSIICYGQLSGDNYLQWSPPNKLTTKDFKFKGDSQLSNSYAQFFIGFDVNGFDAFTKNFNKKVYNCFIKSASWIDTSSHKEIYLKHQQTLFDIAEIYAREFRKKLKENRKQFLKGAAFAKTLNAEIMASFAERRAKYETETKSATDSSKQIEWENEIINELTSLSDYSKESK